MLVDTPQIRDNGGGIAELQTCCQRYYTSKLRSFEGLAEVVTYGFRGEALNSICALAEVSITTRTAEALVGSKATYDALGQAVSCVCVLVFMVTFGLHVRVFVVCLCPVTYACVLLQSTTCTVHHRHQHHR